MYDSVGSVRKMVDKLGSVPSGFLAENPTIYKEILTSLNDMRLKNQHCDVVFKVGKERFPAHRVVLAACSPYFRAMFASFSESLSTEIALQGVGGRGVDQVFTYFYTGQVELNHKNFESVFDIANLWQEPFILGVCEKYLQRELNVSNCLGIYLLTQQHENFSTDLKLYVEKFVFKHFGEVLYEDEFLLLGKRDLVKLIASGKVRVKSEEKIFEAVVRWIRYDTKTRASFVFDVFSQVRFGCMDRDYLSSKVISEDFIQDSKGCMNIVAHILSKSSETEDMSHLQIPANMYLQREKDVLYVFGGLPNANQYTIEAGKDTRNLTDSHCPYDSRKPRLYRHTLFLDVALGETELKEFPDFFLSETDKQPFPAVVISNAVYVIGTTMKKFDTSTRNWHSISTNLSDSKGLDIKNLGVCVWGNIIYAIGGSSKAKWFDISVNVWHKMTFPMIDRYRPGVCSLHNKIYVLGGCDRTYSQSQETVEVYEPLVKKWSFAASMRSAKWGCQAVVLNNQIFAIGG